MAVLRQQRIRPRTPESFPRQIPRQIQEQPEEQPDTQYPQAPQYQPFTSPRSPFDPQIASLRGQLRGAGQPSPFQYQEDPRYANLISQMQGRIGEFENRTSDVLSRLRQTENAPPFAFSDPRYDELRNLISTIQSGQGVGPIDVQSDPAAAAFRTARERQGQRERAQLAERMAATGQLRTGAADISLLAPAGEAGRDIAGFEANLANQRRGELLSQRLAGAQLGLQDIEGARGSALQAYLANRSGRLGSLQAELSGLRGGDPTAGYLNAIQQAQGARGQAFGEYQGQEAARQAAFASDQAALQARLAGLTGEREANRQFGLQGYQANRQAQLEAFEAAAKRARETEGLETGEVQRDLLKEELEQRREEKEERRKEKKGGGGGLPAGGVIPNVPGRTPPGSKKKKKPGQFEF